MTETQICTPTESDSRLTFHETIDSLTGFEEFAIEKAFNAEIYDLSFIKQNRALAFVQLRRNRDLDEKAAKQAVMGMSQAQVVQWFTDTDTDTDDAPESDAPAASTHAAVTATIDPGSEAGKDEPAPA